MTEQTEPQAGPVVKVARDLTEIRREPCPDHPTIARDCACPYEGTSLS